MGDTRLAIVFGGGGARTAYQVGCLRWLARRMPQGSIPIVTGVSMGALNAVHMARSKGTFSEAVDGLISLWSQIRTDRVVSSNWGWLGGVVFRSLCRALGARDTSRTPLAPLDATPLRGFLGEALGHSGRGFPGIDENLADGRLRAVGVTTTDLGSGWSTTWVQALESVGWQEQTGSRGVPATLGVDHLMATMAFPFLLPAVKLGDSWHADGVIRQSNPLLPAMRLGAGRILSISTRHGVGFPSAAPGSSQPPASMHVGGMLMGTVLESMLDVNARMLEELRSLAGRLPERDRSESLPARTLVLRPSRDLGAMAVEHGSRLPRSSRWLARRLGTGEGKNLELYSNMVFDPGYIADLIALGERDAEARGGEIEALIGEDD